MSVARASIETPKTRKMRPTSAGLERVKTPKPAAAPAARSSTVAAVQSTTPYTAHASQNGATRSPIMCIPSLMRFSFSMHTSER